MGFEAAIFNHCTSAPLPIESTMIIIRKLCLIFYSTDIWILCNMFDYNMAQTYVG